MSEAPPQVIAETVERPRLDAASTARLHALVRPGFSVREFTASVSRIEIAALVGLVLLVVGTVLVYSWVILPDQVRNVQLSNEVSDNQTKIDELKQQIADPTEMTKQFEEVQASLDTFRNATLKPRLEGRRAIIETIGRLTVETGAELAGSVEFTTRDPKVDAAAEAKKKRNVRGGEAKEDVGSYPSLKVSFSVQGSYEQLRRFIGQLEASNQFVVIESVNLAAGDDKPTRGARREQPGNIVRLRIEMAAFFQAETPMAIQ